MSVSSGVTISASTDSGDARGLGTLPSGLEAGRLEPRDPSPESGDPSPEAGDPSPELGDPSPEFGDPSPEVGFRNLRDASMHR